MKLSFTMTSLRNWERFSYNTESWWFGSLFNYDGCYFQFRICGLELTGYW